MCVVIEEETGRFTSRGAGVCVCLLNECGRTSLVDSASLGVF